MKDYISQLNLTDKEKEELKQNHELSTAQEQRMLKEKAKVMFGFADKDSFKTLIARTKDELQCNAYYRILNLRMT